MKKFFRIIVAIVLVAVLLGEIGSCAVSVFEPEDTDVVSTVGEVVCVGSEWFETAKLEKYEKWASYYVRLRVVGKGNGGEILEFTVNCDTEMDSEFSEDRSKIPELQVGALVEITHPYKMMHYADYHPDDQRISYVRGYEALSLKLYEGEYNGRWRGLQKNNDYWWGKDFFDNLVGTTSPITVNHVAKITYPMRGYLVYGTEVGTSFSIDRVLWIGPEVCLDGGTRRALNSGATGYTLWANIEHFNEPFDNLDAHQCVFATVNKEDEFTQSKKYKVYDLDEFVGTKKLLVRTDKFDGCNFYYYIKLDSGEVKVLYSEKSNRGYTELCEASASEGSVRGMFPTAFPKGALSGIFPEGVSSGEVYITLESLGDTPVSGELIVAFLPTEELGYPYNE